MKIKKNNLLESTITIQELANFCIRYDDGMGHYPESPYEGYAVFKHIFNSEMPVNLREFPSLENQFNYNE